MSESMVDRNKRIFESHLAPAMFDGDCVIWHGAKMKGARDGVLRPYFWAKDEVGRYKSVYARRFAFELKLGRPVPRSLSALNVCGEPFCVSTDPRHNKLVKQGSWNKRETTGTVRFEKLKTEEEVLED